MYADDAIHAPPPCAGDGEGVAGHITLVSGGAGTMVLGDTIVRAA